MQHIVVKNEIFLSEPIPEKDSSPAKTLNNKADFATDFSGNLITL